MRFALVFPGQGSQSIGMMRRYEDLPAVREIFAEASDILHEDLWDLVENGPEEALNKTVNTQPVMLVAGVAVHHAWKEMHGPAPMLVAGHSLGEYGALVAAGALTLADALPLVRVRARAMQDAVPEGTGGIAAILGLDDETVAAVCAEAAQGQVLEAVNFNAPSQVVIAGHHEAVKRGMDLAKAKGAKRALLLPMSAPSHCSLMRPAAQKLAEALRSVSLQAPQIPVLHNVDVTSHGDPAAIKEALVRQLYSPVRWVETVQEFARREISHIVECGPGKVLAGLTKRIDPNLKTLALADAASLREAVADLS